MQFANLQQQQQIDQQAAALQALAPPKKARGSRKPWTPERFEKLAYALSLSAKHIGSSYTGPAQPAQVPGDAPDSNEWSGISKKILTFPPRYKDLYESRKKINSASKAHKGGLDQNVYLRKEVGEFFDKCGILGEHKFPIDVISGGLRVVTRALLTSSFVAYAEQKGLKHPTEKKYIMRDEALLKFIPDSSLEALRLHKKKVEKKKKEPAKPKRETPQVKILERNGQQVAHFSYDAIPALCGGFILDLLPKNVSQEQKDAIVAVRTHLAELTKVRKEDRKKRAKDEREANKAEKMQKSVVPTQVAVLSVNAQYAMAAQQMAAQQQGQQAGQGPFGNFAPQPGVTFVQPGVNRN